MTGVELTIELDEALYLALRLRAAQERAEPAEVVKALLQRALPGELVMARSAPPLDTVLRYSHLTTARRSAARTGARFITNAKGSHPSIDMSVPSKQNTTGF